MPASEIYDQQAAACGDSLLFECRLQLQPLKASILAGTREADDGMSIVR